MQPPPDDSVPDANTTVGGSPVARLAAPHRFANVSLGPEGFIGQRVSSYPSGNRPPSFPERLPRASSRQAHFEHPTNYRFNDSRPTEVDTSQDPMAPTNMGGRVESPRPSDKERQARNRKTSIYDVAGLASTAYHGNHYGVEWLDIPFIHSCGYKTISPTAAEDVLLCYRDIQQCHRKVQQAWTNPRTHILGPSVERILEKGLPVFPKLLTLTAKETVNFYNKFQELSSGYLLPLMPFNIIRLAFNVEGLFVPGLGTECYADCAAAMMEVLPRFLPPHDSEVQVAISVVRGKSKNGYDIFWRVLELAVPGFDPTIPIEQPRWTRDTDILTFSWEHELYFRLLAKKHVFNDARTRTNMFLRAITSSEYADVITTVQLHVDVFRHEDDDGFLPTHLRLRGIATMLHQNAKAWGP
jgi:hypothetical protein